MIEEIYLELISWLYGLIEDDPIPYEINTLAFYVTNNFEVGFTGTEEEEIKTLEKFFYNPLEAQYFYCPKLYSLPNVEEVLEKLLIKLKKDKYFKNYNLYIGKLNYDAKKIN
mgnify:CR=1 FL=1